MKTAELTPFEATIQQHLNEVASKDSLFAKSLKKANKSLKDCINYIYDTVRKSGRQGFNDDEIYNMAIHYYDEDDIKNIKPLNCKVVVNHTDFEGKKVPAPHREKPKQSTVKQKPIEQLSMF